MIKRKEILSHLEESLKKQEKVFAMWLEGSDGTGSSDEYSDIDIVLAVEDGFELEVLNFCEQVLLELSPLDMSYEEPRHNSKNRYKVFHLENTSKYLLIDLSVQSHLLNFQFVRENDSEIPIILFDKKEIISFIDLNETELKEELKNRLYHLENTIKQKSRVEKYVARNKFIEAMGYYSKFIIGPLVELLRIKYKPVNYDYHIVCISKHLPKEIIEQLDELYKVNSINDLSVHVEKAYRWFYEILDEVKLELN
jgi:predicted nucleotidyltransferase